MTSLLLAYLRKFPIDKYKHILTRFVNLEKQGRFIKYKNGQGVTFNLDLEEYQMKQIFFFDFYEKNTIRHVLKLMTKLKTKPVTCIDVGGNIGFYTLTIDKALTNIEHEIHCFEPNPSTIEYLEKNLLENETTSVQMNPIGLSNKEGTFTLRYNLKNTGTASIYRGDKKGKTVEINVTTLDKYCEERGIGNIDIVKVDIEGAELDFLKGATGIINKSKNLIIIMEIVEENCIAAGYTGEELYKYVVDLGFAAYLPKPWPFGMKKIERLPEHYHDNIIFMK
jgi:FkbM family methyltransferase